MMPAHGNAPRLEHVDPTLTADHAKYYDAMVCARDALARGELDAMALQASARRIARAFGAAPAHGEAEMP